MLIAGAETEATLVAVGAVLAGIRLRPSISISVQCINIKSVNTLYTIIIKS
jgi:hypothetical protein